MSDMRLRWQTCVLLMCIHLDTNLGFIGLNCQQKKRNHLYSAQQTQKKEKVAIMQSAGGAAPPGAGFLLDGSPGASSHRLSAHM